MKDKINKALVVRLKGAMNKKGINARLLAERAQVGPSFVYDILNGKSANPTGSKLLAVAEVLGVSVPYLLSGFKAVDNVYKHPGFGEDYVEIPGLEVENAIGGGMVVTVENKDKTMLFSPVWVKEKFGVRAQELRIISVRGDSMFPTLSESDVLLIDVTKTSPGAGGVFVLFDGNDLVTRRLEYVYKSPRKKDNPHIRIISDNPKYSTFEVSAEEVNIVGKVVWVAKTI